MYVVTISKGDETEEVLVDSYDEQATFTILRKGSRKIKVNNNKIDFIEERRSMSLVGVIGLVALAAWLS